MKKFLILLIGFFFFTSTLMGDGGIFPPIPHEIYETGQTAIVSFRDSIETMIILAEVTGPETEFMWVCPCPSNPTIDSSDADVFYDLAKYSAPRIIQRGWEGCCRNGYYPGYGDYSYGGRGEYNGVDPISNGSIGFFNYEILYATIAESLSAYLSNHGYYVPNGSEQIFQFYINKNWNFFVVAEVDTENANWYEYGTNIQPLKITFSIDSPIYPLRISRIGSTDSEIVIYCIDENKKTFGGAEIRFAKRITEEIMDDFSASELHELLWEGCFLTKCYISLPVESMDDLTIINAPDNNEFHEVKFYSSIPGNAVIFVCCFGLFLFFKKKSAKLLIMKED